jgi:hypothetical protein
MFQNAISQRDVDYVQKAPEESRSDHSSFMPSSVATSGMGRSSSFPNPLYEAVLEHNVFKEEEMHWMDVNQEETLPDLNPLRISTDFLRHTAAEKTTYYR